MKHSCEVLADPVMLYQLLIQYKAETVRLSWITMVCIDTGRIHFCGMPAKVTTSAPDPTRWYCVSLWKVSDYQE